MIDNGSFTGTLRPWRGQDTEPRVINDQLFVDTVGEYSRDYTRDDVDSGTFPLDASHPYIVTFDAAASPAADIAISVQPFDDDEPALFRRVHLTSTFSHETFAFTPDRNSRETIVSFELGGHSQTHHVRIDNVSLRRIY